MTDPFRDLPLHLPCPPHHNDSHSDEKKDQALLMFKRDICPGLKIVRMLPSPGMGDTYKCAWLVEYKYNERYVPGTTCDVLMTQFHARAPYGCSIIRALKDSLSGSWLVEYGIPDCGCWQDPP